MSEKSAPIISHVSLNEGCPNTILLLHGGFSDYREWLPVSKHLSTYHLLIPNLHSNGSDPSNGIRPFTLEHVTPRLADLVQRKAKNGKAHIVGASLGAHTGTALAGSHPEIIDVVFVTGYNRFVPTAWKAVLPYLLYSATKLEDMLPNSAVSSALDGADVSFRGTRICTVALSREMLDIVVSDKSVLPVRSRTLVVAATKGNWYLPTNDNPEHSRKLLRSIKEGHGCQESRAVQNPAMRHPWHVQAPDIFAQTVLAWIEGGALPEGFSDL